MLDKGASDLLSDLSSVQPHAIGLNLNVVLGSGTAGNNVISCFKFTVKCRTIDVLRGTPSRNERF